MTATATLSAYGELTRPDTLRIERLMPGPVDRVWAYLTESDLRRQWLASGVMDGVLGSPFELVWRNDELTDPPGAKPEGFGDEHRMTCTILAFDAPHHLSFTWGENAEVAFELEPRGEETLLTLVHQRIVDRKVLLNVSAGWHGHLDIMAAKLAGRKPAPFWDRWLALRAEYDQRLP